MAPASESRIPPHQIFDALGNSIELDDGKFPKLEIDFEPNAKDLGELRYAFYVHNGLDAINIRPIETSWLNNIWKNVPIRLQLNYASICAGLSDEVCDDYKSTVRRAMIKSVLIEPEKIKHADLESGPRSDEMLRKVPKPWRADVLKAKKKLVKHLHAINPVLAYLNMVWRAVFRWVHHWNLIL